MLNTKINIWIVGVLANVCMCISCNSDEPKLEPSVQEPPTETEDKTPHLEMEYLTGKTWLGRYFIEYKEGSAVFQRVLVTFTNKDGLSGTGKMTVSNTDISTEYQFDFKIKDDTVMCKALKIGDKNRENDIDVLFKFRDNLLYLDSPDFEPVVLSKDNETFSDATGILGIQVWISPIKTPAENRSVLAKKLAKIWLHEKGMNILDFRNRAEAIYQVTAPGSKECTYFDTPLDLLVDENHDFRIRFHGWLQILTWDIKVLTENVMVLQDDINDEVKIVDIFYAASRDVVPPPPSVSKYSYYASQAWGIGGVH